MYFESFWKYLKGLTVMRYSTALLGLLKLAWRALSTFDRSNPMRTISSTILS